MIRPDCAASGKYTVSTPPVHAMSTQQRDDLALPTNP